MLPATSHSQTIHQVDPDGPELNYLPSPKDVQPNPEQPGLLNRFAKSVWNHMKENPAKWVGGALVVAGACVISCGAIPAVVALLSATAATLYALGTVVVGLGITSYLAIKIAESDDAAIAAENAAVAPENVYDEIYGRDLAPNTVSQSSPNSNDGSSDPRAVAAVVHLAAGLAGLGGGGGGGGSGGLGGCALM